MAEHWDNISRFLQDQEAQRARLAQQALQLKQLKEAEEAELAKQRRLAKEAEEAELAKQRRLAKEATRGKLMQVAETLYGIFSDVFNNAPAITGAPRKNLEAMHDSDGDPSEIIMRWGNIINSEEEVRNILAGLPPTRYVQKQIPIYSWRFKVKEYRARRVQVPEPQQSVLVNDHNWIGVRFGATYIALDFNKNSSKLYPYDGKEWVNVPAEEFLDDRVIIYPALIEALSHPNRKHRLLTRGVDYWREDRTQQFEGY